MAKGRILLADDHTLVAEAFKRLLEPEFDVVGTVGDGRALLRAAPELKPRPTPAGTERARSEADPKAAVVADGRGERTA